MIRTKYVIAPIKNIAIEGRTTILMNVDKIKEKALAAVMKKSI